MLGLDHAVYLLSVAMLAVLQRDFVPMGCGRNRTAPLPIAAGELNCSFPD
jgi:hypothetical protein